jgi:hypothetical protein
MVLRARRDRELAARRQARRQSKSEQVLEDAIGIHEQI